MKDIAIQLHGKMRANLGQRVAMFDNDWEDQLDAELKKQFHEKTYPKVKLMIDTSMNIFRRIVREICSVYKEPAKRIVKDAGENVQDKVNDYYRKIKLDQTMQVAHRYAKAATVSFLLVRPVDEVGGVVLRVLTPDQVYVETDAEDSTEMELFAYTSEITDKDGNLMTVWICYTDQETWWCDNAGKVLVIDPRTGVAFAPEQRVNGFGIIPAVAFPAEYQVRGFFNPNWNRDAAEANLKIGLMLTYMNYLVKTQSFKQITVSAGQEGVPPDLKDQILDPLFPLLIGGGAQATTLDLNTQLEAIDQVIRGKVMAIANNYGISNENFSLTTQAASGFSLKIANQALQDIREADIPLCESVEQRIYDVLSKVAPDLPEGLQIQFNPGEVSWPEEWTTEQSRWEFEFKNGLSSPVDYLIERDPQKSRGEAVAYIKTRQEEIRMLKPTMSSWELVASNLAQQGAGAPAAGTSTLAEVASANPTNGAPNAGT